MLNSCSMFCQQQITCSSLPSVPPRSIGIEGPLGQSDYFIHTCYFLVCKFTELVRGRGPEFESRQGWQTKLKSGLQQVAIMTMAGCLPLMAFRPTSILMNRSQTQTVIPSQSPVLNGKTINLTHISKKITSVG